MDIYEAERLWAENLRGKSLVVQVEYDDELARKALQRIGYLIQRGDRYAVETGHLASLLIGLNLIASAELESGALWAQIMRALNNLDNSPSNQTLITQLHRKALNYFQLQRFEHPLGRIGEIILHSGIPVNSQRYFVKRLIHEYRTEPDFSAEAFNAFIRGLPRESMQSKGIDAPTWHFINQAGAIADDFVAKCIEVLDDMQDGTYDEGGGAGLPKRVIEEIVRIVSEIGVLTRTKGARRVLAPKIIWEPALSSQIELRLPIMPEHDHSATEWSLESQGRLATEYVAATPSGLSPHQSLFSIRHVTPAISASAISWPRSGYWPIRRTWNIKLFNEDSPVLIFDNVGHLDTQKGPLEPALYRILVPENHKGAPSKVEVDGNETALRIDAPLGWGIDTNESNWVAYEVDLSRAEELSIFTGGNQRATVRRAVSIYKKPTIEDLEIVDGVFDQNGAPVYAHPPSYRVPTSLNPNETWRYSIQNLETKEVIFQDLLSVGGVITPEFAVEFDGLFEIFVSRGLGTGVRQRFNIVSGLSAVGPAITRALRSDGGGLDDFTATLQRFGVEKTFALSALEPSIMLSDQQISSQSLILKPRHESLELFNTKSEKNSSWIKPVQTHIEDLENLQLFASISNAEGMELIGRWADQSVVYLKPREVKPRFKFNLGEFAETANSKGAFDFYLKTRGDRVIRCGQSIPRKMIAGSNFEVETSTLNIEFTTKLIPANLEIAFYPTLAPWSPPKVLPVESTSVVVPKEILNFGKVFFTLGIKDPWKSSVFSAQVDSGNPNTSSFWGGNPESDDSPAAALAHWLQTGDQSDKTWETSTEVAWRCLLLEQVHSGAIVNRRTMRAFAAELLNRDTDEALLKYPVNLRSDEHYLKHLFITSLVSAPQVKNGLDVSSFAGKPFLACLMSGTENLEELFELAIGFWGLVSKTSHDAADDADHIADAILYKAGIYAPVPQLINAYGLEELMSWSEDYVPGALFEGGTMAKTVVGMAASVEDSLEMLDVRELGMAIEDSVRYLDDLPTAYSKFVSVRPFAADALRETIRKTRGLLYRMVDLPALSLRLAALSRLAARGDLVADQIWRKHREVHRHISTVAPQLVEADLTLAELFYLSNEKRDR